MPIKHSELNCMERERGSKKERECVLSNLNRKLLGKVCPNFLLAGYIYTYTVHVHTSTCWDGQVQLLRESNSSCVGNKLAALAGCSDKSS